MSNTQYTQSQLVQEISASLSDSGNVYWSVDEVGRAINEGLLYWGALTTYWNSRGTFNTVASTPFYDLSDVLSSLRHRTITFDQLTREIQYHLLEPANGLAGTGLSSQFTISQITTALTRWRNNFVFSAGMPMEFGLFSFAAPPDGRAQLDTTISLIQRAAWLDTASAVYRTLRREDAWSAQSYNPMWNLQAGMPFAYSTVECSPGEIQVYPAPALSGQIHLIYAQTRNFDLVGQPTSSLMMPDEIACGIKYSAMYELLATYAPSADPMRAKYCLERSQAAVKAGRDLDTVIRVRVNNRNVPLDTISNLDAKRPYWMNRLGTPNFAACAYDILALSDVPNSVLTITCDVNAAAPLPTTSGSVINLEAERIPYIFDYCRHILSFKLGGSEFVSTMPLYDNFLSGAEQYNSILRGKCRYLTPLFSQAKKEQEIVPIG